MKIPKSIYSRLRHDPIGTLRLVVRYSVIDRLMYFEHGGYDARRYWQDRFLRHGFSLLAVGHEGLSEEDNRENYFSARAVFLDFCAQHEIALSSAKVLEVGCGTGFYTGTLRDSGVTDYVGIDIADVFLPRLRGDYPEYEFLQRDVTADPIGGCFDVIVMMDVIQHIVSRSRFRFAMENLKRCLADNGVLIIAPVGNINKKSGKLFIRLWSRDDIARSFTECRVYEPIRYGDGTWLVGIRKAG